MQSAAVTVWRIRELQDMIMTYCTPGTFRALACTSRDNREEFTPNAWEHLDGIGNLFAVLHDSLRVDALGIGSPVVPVSSYIPMSA
jgi:hypothetical protein